MNKAVIKSFGVKYDGECLNLFVKIILHTGHARPCFEAGIAREMVFPEGIVVRPPPHVDIHLELIPLKDHLTAGTNHEVTLAVVLERVIPEHDILHKIPPIFKIDATPRGGAAISFKSVFLDDPALPPAKPKTQPPVAREKVIVKMHVRRGAGPEDGPVERGGFSSFGLRLIKFQMDEFPAFRYFCFLKLNTGFLLKELHILVIEACLVIPVHHRRITHIPEHKTELEFPVEFLTRQFIGFDRPRLQGIRLRYAGV